MLDNLREYFQELFERWDFLAFFAAVVLFVGKLFFLRDWGDIPNSWLLTLLLIGASWVQFRVWCAMKAWRNPVRDLSLADISARMARDLFWYDAGWEVWNRISVEARQRAIDGDLTIWGRAGQNGLFPLMKIEPALWSHLSIDPVSLSGGTPRTHPLNHFGGNTVYSDLHVSSAQANRVWPRASILQRLQKKIYYGVPLFRTE